MTEYLHRDPTRRDTLLTIEEVAELMRMPVASLRYWRVLGTGPLGFIIGRRPSILAAAMSSGALETWRATACPRLWLSTT